MQAPGRFRTSDKALFIMHQEDRMDSRPVLDLNAFVPAKDFELAKQFYTDLGFTFLWGNAEIAQFQIGSFRFLLQNFFVEQHAHNFMMSLAVEDADVWWQYIEGK